MGLEVHIKLNSENKLFCQCLNVQSFNDLEANTHICPVCMGHPGALPVLNIEPLEKAVRLGLALGCHVNEYSTFDRKSYFYPDLPMGYQITQQIRPTNIDGEVHFFVDKEFNEERCVRIRDAHIETDTGKSIREGEYVFLDYNRAGTPLVEIVTHPDFRSSEEVIMFLKELQRIARYNGVGDVDMEKGQMRVDVNISLRPEGVDWFGTRVELKNMNSFSAIQRAIDHEVSRQTAILKRGDMVQQQTRGRDDPTKNSYCMRSKEDAMDYRYMPEPDLPVVHQSQVDVDKVRSHGVVLPFERIRKYREQYEFNKEYINGLISDVETNMYFESTVKDGYAPQEVAKWVVGPIARWCNDKQVSVARLPFARGLFVQFLDLLKSGGLAAAQAKIVIKKMLETGKDPHSIIEQEGLQPVDQGQVQQRLDQVFAEKPELLDDIKSGNMKPIGFIIGQVMQKSRGSADPGAIKELVMGYK